MSKSAALLQENAPACAVNHYGNDFATHGLPGWLRLPDGRVLDATFDQFCSEDPIPVYLGAPTEFHVSGHHHD